ncbi:Sir2 family NAD-dependent protein deacetylase [Caballeronia sp. Lep1P3]|uniref:SIR2 family NAD-dependent protein deacylase n=1 Tax=Caballeronia sp. Lep1P3 TaxID=2878150 RepID=UPI001FD15692|nr:Sir2 family NAD-dependent protein deacetylase [Caballeronia sp. Lep1P3]
MSVDSGLPAFRGSDGLWTALLPEGMSEREVGSLTQGDCFVIRPEQAWTFYGHALDACRHATPHDGYRLIRAWAADKRHGAFAYTSNVDGQFQTAGFPDDRVVECHGTIHSLQCTVPCTQSLWHTGRVSREAGDALPACIHCGALARPNFLMFSDVDWVPVRTATQQANLRKWRADIERPVVLEIGAGLAVPSIRLFAETFGAPLIRINLEDERVDRVTDVGIRGTALAVLREIDAALTAGARLVETIS